MTAFYIQNAVFISMKMKINPLKAAFITDILDILWLYNVEMDNMLAKCCICTLPGKSAIFTLLLSLFRFP